MKERGDFETHNSNQDDFLEVSIWGLKAMPEEAFEAGRKARMKNKDESGICPRPLLFNLAYLRQFALDIL